MRTKLVKIENSDILFTANHSIVMRTVGTLAASKSTELRAAIGRLFA